jgi:hypothetical protein
VSTVAFGGKVSDGAVVSLTVTVKDFATALFPCTSLAVHVTVVVSNGNVAPLGGVQLTVTLLSKLSVADAMYVNAAPLGPVASTVAFAGTVITGAVVSITVTVNVLVATFA